MQVAGGEEETAGVMTLATVIKGNKIYVLTNSIQNEQEKHLVCGWEENNNSVPTDIVK